MKKFANDLEPLDAADGAAARRRQVKCQQALLISPYMHYTIKNTLVIPLSNWVDTPHPFF